MPLFTKMTCHLPPNTNTPRPPQPSSPPSRLISLLIFLQPLLLLLLYIPSNCWHIWLTGLKNWNMQESVNGAFLQFKGQFQFILTGLEMKETFFDSRVFCAHFPTELCLGSRRYLLRICIHVPDVSSWSSLAMSFILLYKLVVNKLL